MRFRFLRQMICFHSRQDLENFKAAGAKAVGNPAGMSGGSAAKNKIDRDGGRFLIGLWHLTSFPVVEKLLR